MIKWSGSFESAALAAPVDSIANKSPSRWVYAAMTMYLDEDAYEGLVDVVYAAETEVKTIEGGTLLLTPQPISLSMVEKSQALGRDPMNITDKAQLCR